MTDLADEVLVSLRRIIRATDLHSRRLDKETGLTTPQLVVLKDIEQHASSSVSEIARQISLSQATVTNILPIDQEQIRQTNGMTSNRRI